MTADTSTADIAIDDSVADISSDRAAAVFINTLISSFEDNFTIENPEKVKQAVKPVVRALQGLHRKGYDMRPYAERLVAQVAEEFQKYSGEKRDIAYQSTLIVTDHIMHKRGTGYWKREKK